MLDHIKGLLLPPEFSFLVIWFCQPDHQGNSSSACLPKANCAKAAETIKSSPEDLGAQPAPGFCSTRRLPCIFRLKRPMSPCLVKHGDWWHWWLESCSVLGPAAALDALMPSYCCASELKGTSRQKGFYGSSGLSYLLPSRAPSGPVWSIAKWGWVLVYGYFWQGLDTGWRQPHVLYKSGSLNCRGTGSCSNCYLGLGLSLLILWGIQCSHLLLFS